jgi:hypothetical protein
MAKKPLVEVDPARLAEFQAGIRKRYSDDQILAELRACAERLGRSPRSRRSPVRSSARGASRR